MDMVVEGKSGLLLSKGSEGEVTKYDSFNDTVVDTIAVLLLSDA